MAGGKSKNWNGEKYLKYSIKKDSCINPILLIKLKIFITVSHCHEQVSTSAIKADFNQCVWCKTDVTM